MQRQASVKRKYVRSTKNCGFSKQVNSRRVEMETQIFNASKFCDTGSLDPGSGEASNKKRGQPFHLK